MTPSPAFTPPLTVSMVAGGTSLLSDLLVETISAVKMIEAAQTGLGVKARSSTAVREPDPGGSGNGGQYRLVAWSVRVGLESEEKNLFCRACPFTSTSGRLCRKASKQSKKAFTIRTRHRRGHLTNVPIPYRILTGIFLEVLCFLSFLSFWRAAAAKHRTLEERMIAHIVVHHICTGGLCKTTVDVNCAQRVCL